MTQVRVMGCDPAVQERAALTDRQAECLDLHLRGASYRRIAIMFGLLSHVTAREHVQKALQKLERAMRPEPVVEETKVRGPAKYPQPRRTPVASEDHDAVVGVNPFA